MPYGNERNPHISAATVTAIKTAFDQARVGHDSWQSFQPKGRLDQRNIWRADALPTRDIFKWRRAASPARLNVHLLVDASGSMGSRADRWGRNPLSRWQAAQDAAANLVEAFRKAPTVRLNVWQHSEHSYSVRLTNVYKPGRDRLKTMGNNVTGGNADAFALRAIGDRALAECRPDERAVIIVISDGAPTDSGYGSKHTDVRGLVRHSQQVAADLRRKGAIVIGVSIVAGDDGVQKQMYGEQYVVHFEDDWVALGRSFATILGRTLRGADVAGVR